MYPRIYIDIQKLEQNARIAARICRGSGISVIGVTKACQGLPEIGMALIKGGVEALGDSRIENLIRLRAGCNPNRLFFLRPPMMSEVSYVVEEADISFNSSIEVIRALSESATKLQKTHGIVVMIESGDNREGVPVSDVPLYIEEVLNLPGLEFTGLATNIFCFNKKRDPLLNLEVMKDLVDELGETMPSRSGIISAGNSSVWDLIESGKMPESINQVRLGELILLGHETWSCRSIPALNQGVFVIEAEIIEANEKNGESKVIVAIGKQDIVTKDLTVLAEGATIIGATSDHLVLRAISNDVFHVGQTIPFRPGYGSLLRAMISSSVKKVIATRNHSSYNSER